MFSFITDFFSSSEKPSPSGAYSVTAKGEYKPMTKDLLNEYRALQRQANRHLESRKRPLLACDGILGSKTHAAVQDGLGMSLPLKTLADNPGRYSSELSSSADSMGLPVVECPSGALSKLTQPAPTVHSDGSVTYQMEGIGGIPYWAIGLAAAGGFYLYKKKRGVKKPFGIL